MSHHPTQRSPKGTPTADRTVGELVADNPRHARVFHRHAIDFCCQGGRTLRTACEAKGLDPAALVAELESAGKPTEGEDNAALLPPAQLADHIEATYHRPLREELPRLCGLAAKVAKVHGSRHPSLHAVNLTLARLSRELLDHMAKEEGLLFPLVRALAEGKKATIDIEGPVGCMMHEHEDAGAALARLRELTDGYQPPIGACESYKALFAGLEDLETTMHRHVHLENSVLFPAAERMAGSPGAGGEA